MTLASAYRYIYGRGPFAYLSQDRTLSGSDSGAISSVGRNRLVPPVVLAGTFTAIRDVAPANVAIPSIREDLLLDDNRPVQDRSGGS